MNRVKVKFKNIKNTVIIQFFWKDVLVDFKTFRDIDDMNSVLLIAKHRFINSLSSKLEFGKNRDMLKSLGVANID